jgi:hypothetical protein
MSPATSEKVVNKALSGAEMKEIIRKDFDRLLDNCGELSHYVAYGKAGWKILLTLQTGNARSPESTSTIVGGDEVEEVTGAKELEHQFDSPNQERLIAGMPIPVVTKALDGTTQTQMVQYPPQPELEADVKLADVTPREKDKLWRKKNP